MILCTAPSKTFNLAGLQVSNIWVPGKEVRDRFKAEINAAGYSQLNALGLIACQAAYEMAASGLSSARHICGKFEGPAQLLKRKTA